MVTSRLELEYLRPVHTDTTVRINAKVTAENRFLADVSCRIELEGGQLAVRGRARLARPIRSK